MELKKGYKQTEVGIIPEDWNFIPIGDICTKIQDGNYGGSYPKSKEFVSFGIPFLTSKVLGKEGNLKERLIDFITEDKHSILAKAHLSLNDVLFTNRGASVGAIGFVDERICNGNIGPQLTLIRANESLLKPLFLYQALKSNFVQRQILGQDSGSAMNFFGIGSTKKFQIPLPATLTEQTAIATALSDTDALISRLETLIAKKQAIKQGAMRQLLKPKEGWVVKKLGEIGECIIGLTYSPSNVQESGLLVLRSSNIQGNSLHYDNNVFVNIDVPEKIIVKENDILICVRNGSKDLIGKCALIKGRAIGETFGAFMSVFRSPYNEFVFNLFQSGIIKRQIDEHLGATINQITNKSLNSFEIPFPDPEEQTRIVQILSDMDAEIAGLEQKLSKYKRLKQGMMQELLTGKTRLV